MRREENNLIFLDRFYLVKSVGDLKETLLSK